VVVVVVVHLHPNKLSSHFSPVFLVGIFANLSMYYAEYTCLLVSYTVTHTACMREESTS